MDRARLGTSSVASVNDPRGHAGSSQNQRRLRHSTTTAPARGTSRSRWSRRSFTRAETTPQAGQPGTPVDSTVIRRTPKAVSAAERTRYSGRLKITVAAQGCPVVGSIKTSHGSKLSSCAERFFLCCAPCGVFVVAGVVP